MSYPSSVAEADDLECEIAGTSLSYGVFTQDGEGPSRFPTSGWLDGSVEDLADLVRLVSVPQHAVDRAAEVLEEGIGVAENILEEVAKLRPFVAIEIAELLGMTNVRQTWRMAGAIIANALIFQERLTGVHGTVKSLDEVCGEDMLNPKKEVLTAWTEILAINYWPIFAICARHRPKAPDLGRGSDPAGASRNGAGRQRYGRQQCARPDGTGVSAADCRPEVPGDVLHAARLGGAAGAVGRGEDGGCGLV